MAVDRAAIFTATWASISASTHPTRASPNGGAGGNDLVLDISANGKSCAVELSLRLKRGKTQLSMFSGSKFYYCSTARVVRTTCNAN